MVKDLLRLLRFGSTFGAISIFILSFLAALSEITAFVLMAIFVRLIEKGTLRDFFGLVIEYSHEMLMKIAIAIPTGLGIAVILNLITTILITREGRIYFERLAEGVLDEARKKLAAGADVSMVDVNGTLKYDSRYAGVSYMHLLRLIYPVVLTIGILSFAFAIEKNLTLIVFFCVLAVFPFHFKLMKWGNMTAIRIREGAVQRGETVDHFTSLIYQHPNPDALADFDSRDLSRSSGNKKYMDAYVDRQRLGGFSNAISDVSIIAAVIIISLVLVFRGTAEGFALSNLIIGLIVFRFLVRNTRTVVQSVTTIVALQPFFIRVYKIFDMNSHSAAPAIIGTLKKKNPLRLAAITFEPFNHWQAQKMIRILSGAKTGKPKPYGVISSGFPLLSSDWRAELGLAPQFGVSEFRRRYVGLESNISEIKTFIEKADDDKNHDSRVVWSQLSRQSQFLLLSMAFANAKTILIVNGVDCLSMNKEQLEAFMTATAPNALVMLFNAPPRNIRVSDDFQLGVMVDENLNMLGSVANYAELKAQIDSYKVDTNSSKSYYETEVYGI